jgi:membrane-associated phospholipid phosphatase
MTFLALFSLVYGAASAEPVYELDPVADGSVLAAGMAIGLVERVFLPLTAPAAPQCTLTDEGRCDPTELHPWDAAVVGQWNEDWALVTDVALAGAFVLPYGVLAVDSLLSPSDARVRDFLVDSSVVLESFLVSNVAVITLKHAMNRPRPTQYTHEAPEETFAILEHQLSFPSGHAAAVGSAMSSTALTWWLRHPESPARWVFVGGALGLTSLTAVGRVQAGKHFPSDVFAGAILGSAIGLAVPWMHLRDSPVRSSVTWTPQGAMVSLSGRFPSLHAGTGAAR